MQVDLHNALRDPQVVKATRVLIRDKHDNPIAFFVEDGDMIHHRTIDDPDFQQALADFGINRTLIINTIDVTHKP